MQNKIIYKKPNVVLLSDTGLGVAEYASRTCYDSFHKSENKSIVEHDIEGFKDIESSKLLDSLAWVHFHHSVLEHIVLSYYIKGVSRGVLQEHSRHRIQSISVKSTRYTMSDILFAFISSLKDKEIPVTWFVSKMLELDILSYKEDKDLAYIEIRAIYDKLNYQLSKTNFIADILTDQQLEAFREIGSSGKLFETLKTLPKKRNIGDNFKHIVTDNFLTDMVVTFNLRSLKNYLSLRGSNSAWSPMQELAQEIKKATPIKYLKLIDKEFK